MDTRVGTSKVGKMVALSSSGVAAIAHSSEVSPGDPEERRKYVEQTEREERRAERGVAQVKETEARVQLLTSSEAYRKKQEVVRLREWQEGERARRLAREEAKVRAAEGVRRGREQERALQGEVMARWNKLEDLRAEHVGEIEATRLRGLLDKIKRSRPGAAMVSVL